MRLESLLTVAEVQRGGVDMDKVRLKLWGTQKHQTYIDRRPEGVVLGGRVYTHDRERKNYMNHNASVVYICKGIHYVYSVLRKCVFYDVEEFGPLP